MTCGGWDIRYQSRGVALVVDVAVDFVVIDATLGMSVWCRLVVDAKQQRCMPLAEFIEKNGATGVTRHTGPATVMCYGILGVRCSTV